MALVHFWTSLRCPVRGTRRLYLLFAIHALIAALYSVFEWRLIHAQTPAEYLARLQLQDLTSIGLLAPMVVIFVWAYFDTGRKWLAVAGVVLMEVSMTFNLGPVPRLVFLEVTAVRQVPTFGGATYAVADGVHNPWNALCYLGVVLMLLYVLDASVAVWKRGETRRAIVVGGSVVFFYISGGIHSALVDAGVVQTPYLLTFHWLFILAAMAWELSNDQLRVLNLSEELRTSRERMRLAAQATDLGIWEWDIGRGRIWVNEQGRRRVGLGTTDTMDMQRFFETVHPDDRQRTKQALQKSVEEKSDLHIEFRLLATDGQIRWMSTRGQIECDTKGIPHLMRGVSIDITRNKVADAEFRQVRNELAHYNRNAALNEIAASLAHEINQPLGAILNNATAARMLNSKADHTPRAVAAILEDIEQDARRASQIVRNVRSMAGREEMTCEPLDVNDVIESFFDMMGKNMSENGVALELDLRADLPLVNGNRVGLQQVLMNLTSNALEAMRSAPSRTIKVSTATYSHQEVLISVNDTGSGLHPEQINRLFEPFFTTKTEGLGIGLRICRTIIEEFEGKIWAESHPGCGATFNFTMNNVESLSND